MENIILIVLICILMALIAYRVVNKHRERGQIQVPINSKNGENIDNTSTKNHVNIDEKIGKLILEKQMIKAVKEYRIATGAGLMEAKNHVDALAVAIKEGKQVVLDKQPKGNKDELDARLRKLLSDGQKVKAVKVCREATGYDLLKAKRYVESLN
ncbi:ribosomal protein L7/L12 [Clostridium hydrogenum]|uniref:ribosomal protein L7/L12 n=1 Tax=Clostridium hydrogenum TaxID=2855764 RepID=UPI001F3D8577|nr:ribosomal protein L7/L12 [Clostridium hydrogenum]